MILFSRGVARLSTCIAGTFLLTTSLLHVWQINVENEGIVLMKVGNVLKSNMIMSDLRAGRQEQRQAWYRHLHPEVVGMTIGSREMPADQRRETAKKEPHSPSDATGSKITKGLRKDEAKKPSGILSHRQRFEVQYPPDDVDRVRRRVVALRPQRPTTQRDVTYDPFNCPDLPPQGYPMTWRLASRVLRHWNVDSTTIPHSIHQGLCVFDWETESAKAVSYRKAEVPFVVTNHPDILRTAERWNHPGYLSELVGKHPQRNDHSRTGHFMFWRLDQSVAKLPKGWEPPTDETKLTFDEWLERANELEEAAATGYESHSVANRDHYYFRLNGNERSNSYLYDELPVFKPLNQSTFMIVDPEDHPGINCRFGSRGSVAEAHFDVSRNFILLLGGKRRYILSPPSECANMELHPDGHPSSRHSQVDWSNPPRPDSTRPFARVVGNEVVLQAGDALYLPDLWFHFIVSLGASSLRTHVAALKHTSMLELAFF